MTLSKRKSIALAGIAIFGSTSSASAADWQMTTITGDELSLVYVDVETIFRWQGTDRFWMALVHSRESDNAAAIDMQDVSVNCSDRTYFLHGYVSYRENGSTIEGENWDLPYRPERIPPQSIVHWSANVVCGDRVSPTNPDMPFRQGADIFQIARIYRSIPAD